jgi:hypothetical protein
MRRIDPIRALAFGYLLLALAFFRHIACTHGGLLP